ncbi:hypothetical protein H2200_005600 [Cladophialophora chaetospira]|uniref:Glucose-methanol-choline oxidoreductase N-terminal domain-containing protein n=1 Tax=Cladophialophora chaetospira TaxID=386627 RepID=A0AA38XCA9_9EURO|nr:hypothetical protein H2200_005600 [Cladophialophora chaetospira]
MGDSTASTNDTYDYIIVGGGVSGLVLASRLSRLIPSSDRKQILVLEAGGDPLVTESEHILSSQTAHLARDSPHSYQLTIAPNKNLGGRSVVVPVGKALGGSAVINGGAWTRGSKSDYDLWSRIVKDDDWSYEKLLPYMKRVESMAVREENGVVKDESQHGYDGPVKAVPVRTLWPNRKYPLRDTVQMMWEEAGDKYLVDGNNGDQNGLTELVEVWVDGMRQLPHKVFDLSKIEIRTGSAVQRVTFDESGAEPAANGVDLSTGEHLIALKEVIVAAGAYHSPQILKLSGIGDPQELQKHGIKTILKISEVGKNLMDHLAVGIVWKLKHGERGLAIGSPLFNEPTYFSGWPLDFIRFGPLDNLEKLEPFIKSQEDRDFLLRSDASHVEIVTLYAPMAKYAAKAPLDGNYISTMAGCLTPTSRGSITLQSARVGDPPVIDVNFVDTEVDKFILREAIRKAAAVHLGTEVGKSFISHELPPEGYVAIADATDEELNKRIADLGYSFDHPMGSCSMGKVVDSHCRVFGVKGLRVVDASVFPIPISCHPQAAVYATAERVAEWIGRGEQ